MKECVYSVRFPCHYNDINCTLSLSCIHFTVVLSEGDRKANIEVLEANKSSNKDEIKRLRDDNKDLRQKLALLQRVRKFKILYLLSIFLICFRFFIRRIKDDGKG